MQTNTLAPLPRTIANLKPCDTCRTPSPYEPITVSIPGGIADLAASLPFHCPTCIQAADDAEQQRARDAIRIRREQKWETSIPKKYRETETTHPDFPLQTWTQIRNLPLDSSIGLIGPAGRCKTRILALIARRAIATDRTVGWCPANQFQWAATREFDATDGTDARQAIKQWLKADILILDDLGKHRWTDNVESHFFNLLEQRAGNKLPILWSMNPDPSDIPSLPALLHQDTAGILTRALDPEGKASAKPRFAPIVSRLLDEVTIIPIL